MKRQKSQPLQEEVPIPMQPPVLQLSPETILIPREAERPSARDIQKAIDVLVACQVARTSIASVGQPGDVFLVYDLTLMTPGRPPFRISDRRTLHSLLTKENITSAGEAFDVSLIDIQRPMKSTLLNWINSATAAAKEAEPRAPLTLSYGK